MSTSEMGRWGGQLNSSSDGEMMWVGHPSEGGTLNVIFEGSKHALASSLEQVGGAMWVEEAFEVQALDFLPRTNHRAGGRRLAEQVVDSGLWGLDRIDSECGLDERYSNYGLMGEGVHIYVLDTGIRTTHAEFEGRAVPEIDYIQRRYCRGDPECAVDRHGHGTHCAGTAAGMTVGVAKRAIVHAVKVLGDDGRGSSANIIRAIDYVAALGKRPAVISMSLGCGRPCMSPLQYRAIMACTTADVTVVVAAGNSGNSEVPDACEYAPSDSPSAITVGSITRDRDRRSSFSSVGECLDIFAPGSDVLSAGVADDAATAVLSGTSMACPHVAGVAALMLGQSPNLTAPEIKAAILGGALDMKVADPRDSPNKLLFIGDLLGLAQTQTNRTNGTCGQLAEFESGARWAAPTMVVSLALAALICAA